MNMHSFDSIESQANESPKWNTDSREISVKQFKEASGFNSDPEFLVEKSGVHSDKHIERKPIYGYILMMISVLGITTNHLFMKVASFYNPKLTNYDFILFLGLAVFPSYLWANLYLGKSISLSQFERKAQVIVLISAVGSILVNYWNYWGFSLLSIGKSTLIFSLNPLFWMILAFIVLQESIGIITILSAIGAFCGIYFLSLNKASAKAEDAPEGNPILGIFLVFISAWLQASIMILLRQLSIYNIHFLLRPVYSGIAFLTFATCTMIFSPESMVFPNYSFSDVVYLSLSGIGWAIVLGPLGAAFMYEKASRLAPLNYIENVFSILSDVFLFKYVFVATDYIGMVIVVICWLIPAAMKIKNDN